ncbi:calcium:sodium antiporter [Aureococcus anophagefferens]|uniref:Calcium:sodium antiporter n=3 Tax=Aureococcus anophagefferens TaxID=44056 RepID=A0ABR1FRK7_AURAN
MGSFFIDPSDLSTSFYGNCQLMELFIAYAYLLYIGCNMISDGAELLMLTPYSKLVGSCILPVLGAVPDGAIVLFSGVGSDAQTSLDVGVGALAGSTVMLITIPWALAIYGGRVNLDADGQPKYAVSKGTPRLSEGNLWNSGVSVGAGFPVVLYMGYWMLATALPYVVVEIGALVAENDHGGILNQQTIDDDEATELSLQESPAVLVGLLMTLFGFGAYLKYQYDAAYGAESSSPSLEEKQRRATVNTVRGGVGLVAAVRPILDMEDAQRAAGAAEAAPLAPNGKNEMLENVLRPFFSKYDTDNNGTLELSELSRVFEDLNEPKSSDELDVLFKKYDRDGSGSISFDEFCVGMREYVLSKPASYSIRAEAAAVKSKRAELATSLEERKDEEDLEEDDEEEEIPDEFAEDKFKSVEEQQRCIQNAALKLCGLGTLVVLVFSDPVTDVLTEFGDRTGINAFYVGFVVAPLITNGSELLASYTFALKKTQKSMVVAYEQLLGAAVMNNTYCLFIFLILIYAQGLYWDYTAEVISILCAELAIFAVVTTIKVHTVTTACLVLSFYPLTILLVWMLEELAGIS